MHFMAFTVRRRTVKMQQLVLQKQKTDCCNSQFWISLTSLTIGYKMSLLTDSQWVLVRCSFSTIEMDRACLCAFIIDFCKGSFFNLIVYANLFLFLISDSHHTASYRHLVSVYPSRGNWLWARFAQNKLYGVPSFSFSVSSK